MQFWGWLPHLYPSFELKFGPELFERTVLGLDGVQIRVNDNDPDEKSEIKVGPVDGFRYDGAPFPMSIIIGDNRVDSLVTVYGSGMVCFDLAPGWEELTERMDEDQIRYAVREIYFSMKKLFHDDIHHKTDPLGSSDMRYADDNLAIVRAANREEAVMDIFGMIVRKCENTLSMYPGGSDPVEMFDCTVYSLISGFMSYGRNFLNVNRDIIGDRYEVCLASLMSCERSLDGKDREIKSLSTRRLTRNTAKINERMFWLTMLSIAVGFFAGSLLADSIDGLDVVAKSVLVIIGGIAVVSVAVWIYRAHGEVAEDQSEGMAGRRVRVRKSRG